MAARSGQPATEKTFGTLAFTLLGVLLFSHCRVAFRQQPKPQCTTNRSCGSAELCFADKCLRAPAQPKQGIFVELTNKDGTISQRSLADATYRLDLVEAQRYRYTGSVTDATTRTGVDGKFALERASLIPGRRVFYSVAVSNGTFSTLLESDLYSPRFVPTSEQLPPFLFGAWQVEEEDRDLPLSYPSIGSLSVINGRVLASETNELPIAARIFLDVPGTSLTSTATQTDALGFFTLRVAPGISSGRLRVGPSELNEFVPQLIRDGIALSSTTQLDTVYLRDLAASALVSGRVTGIRGTDADAPISNASVFAEVTVGSSGTYRTGTVTDNTGQFTLALVTGSSNAPLDYQITVVPSARSEFARGEMRYTLQPVGEPVAIEMRLPARNLLTGRVLSASGEVVHNAQVSAVAKEGGTIRLGSNQTLTSSEGRFVMALDPGAYTLVVKTSADTQLPWMHQDVLINASTLDVELSLPEAALVAGEVTSVAGAVVSQMTLEWYEQVGSTSVSIGRAVTDAFGHYSVVLPAR